MDTIKAHAAIDNITRSVLCDRSGEDGATVGASEGTGVGMPAPTVS